MPLTIRPSAVEDSKRSARAPDTGAQRRTAFWDNPRLVLFVVVLLLACLGVALTFANRSSRMSQDFLIDFVLYAVSVVDLMMLVGLLFVLARNLIKLVVEKRRGRPFARFRAKLVAVLLALTLVPSVLVLIVGSELITNSVEQWFNAPMDEIVTSATRIASNYYQRSQKLVGERAGRIADALARSDQVAASHEARLEDGVDLIEIFQVVPAGEDPVLTPAMAIRSGSIPASYDAATEEKAARQRAKRVALGRSATVEEPERLGAGGDLIRAAVPVRNSDGRVSDVVLVGTYVTPDVARRARHISSAYERFLQLRLMQRPLTGVYLSFFVMMTLMILVAATWVGLYMAKRITRPVQALNVATKEIGAGHLDHRVEADTADEFGSLVEAFNTMASELAVSRRKLERSAIDLQRKNQEVEERRQYIETILERIATGVVSVDAAGRISTINTAAGRLLALGDDAVGQPVSTVFDREDLRALAVLLERARKEQGETQAQEVALVRDGRDIHLAAVASTMHRDGDVADERVLVFDDITPLIRAQKVAAWREVARRLAHEVKNPLTPIQLSAERLRRHFSEATDPTRTLVAECTTAIVTEVESLKGLVDEFSQFARMPPPKRVPTDVGELVTATVALYNGLFREVTIECAIAEGLRPLSIDPEQIRRVLINLVDNAIEAMERRGRVVIEVVRDEPDNIVRMVVADSGPGIPAAEREKLFLPYYSTKRRGSGLGLAIVRRIVVEHGGSIDVADNEPHGTRFTIELPS